MSKFSKVLSFIFGILLIISGIIAFFNPLNALLTLAYLVGFVMIFSGISNLIYYSDIRKQSGANWILFDGIVSVIFGIIIISNIFVTGAFIPYMAAFWAIFKGIVGIVSSFDLKKSGLTKWYAFLIGGIISLIVGVILIMHPILAAFIVSVMVSISLIIYGAMTIGFCFSVNKK